MNYLTLKETGNEELFPLLESRRIESTRLLDPAQRSQFGQFFTPFSTARSMARLLAERGGTLNILDAGAGVGSLTAAAVEAACNWEIKPSKINATTYEIDPQLCGYLRSTLSECRTVCDRHGISFDAEIIEMDFIEAAVARLHGNTLFATVTQQRFNCAILNPPYRKLQSSSQTRSLLNSVGIETSNLYTAFLWLTALSLDDDGDLVAITPRSFSNGSYFKPFRRAFLKTFSIRNIQVFDRRDSAFSDDSVLQENIILRAVKSSVRNNVVIENSEEPDDPIPTIRTIAYEELVRPDDPDQFIHIVPDELTHRIDLQLQSLTHSLRDLNLSVSTGRVVDFRAAHLLRKQPNANSVPLIYPGHLLNGFINWPRQTFKKANALECTPEAQSLVVPHGCYVLVKRFSAKEEARRVVAAVYDSDQVFPGPVGIENHLNYYHRHGAGVPRNIAVGLAAFLNSTLVDSYVRQFNGHTQVNANDLRSLKYPSEIELERLGIRIAGSVTDQGKLDQIIAEELKLMNFNEEGDPIRGKRKIQEAIEILKLLGVPRPQQNTRSALTLLSLLDLKSDTNWHDASSPHRGITEMMDYFREHYGVTYKPNTRETVRRQTVHQFVQMGLIIPNPDNPERPINSPKTRYVIELNTLTLLKTFGSDEWEQRLQKYLSQAESLRMLSARLRTMKLIPVTLPNGEVVTLSAGGQNLLIKQVVEQFCPRFTQGGMIRYLGGAGAKLRGDELEFFASLGVHLDQHGKMPDVIVYIESKDWLVLIEAVTSHGPVDIKRHNELKALFKGSRAGLVFVTAFESRKSAFKYLTQIAWETEVWCSDEPDHLIHFNGERFLGPYQ